MSKFRVMQAWCGLDPGGVCGKGKVIYDDITEKQADEILDRLRDPDWHWWKEEKEEEFYPKDRFPNMAVPYPAWWRRQWCKWFGHSWRKFLWGGINSMFDCDCCMTCFKMRGPLPENRDTKIYPCKMR